MDTAPGGRIPRGPRRDSQRCAGRHRGALVTARTGLIRGTLAADPPGALAPCGAGRRSRSCDPRQTLTKGGPRRGASGDEPPQAACVSRIFSERRSTAANDDRCDSFQPGGRDAPAGTGFGGARGPAKRAPLGPGKQAGASRSRPKNSFRGGLIWRGLEPSKAQPLVLGQNGFGQVGFRRGEPTAGAEGA